MTAVNQTGARQGGAADGQVTNRPTCAIQLIDIAGVNSLLLARLRPKVWKHWSSGSQRWQKVDGCFSRKKDILPYWGREMHICVSKLTIIGSDNGLSPSWHQAIIWTNAEILLLRTLGTNFSEIVREIHTFPFKKMPLKVSSAKHHWDLPFIQSRWRAFD